MPEKRLDGVVDAVGHRLHAVDVARSQPAGDGVLELGAHVLVVADDEAADRHAAQHRLDEVVDVLAATIGRVLADHPAQRDVAADLHVVQRGHQVRATDVVEVHVDPVRSEPRDGVLR